MSLYQAFRYLFQAVLMMTVDDPPYLLFFKSSRSTEDAYEELFANKRQLQRALQKSAFHLEIGPKAENLKLRADERLEALAAFADIPSNSPAVRVKVSRPGAPDMYLDDTNIENVSASLIKGHAIRVAFEREDPATGATDEKC